MAKGHIVKSSKKEVVFWDAEKELEESLSEKHLK